MKISEEIKKKILHLSKKSNSEELQVLIDILLKDLEEYPVGKILSGEKRHNGKYGSFLGNVTGPQKTSDDYAVTFIRIKKIKTSDQNLTTYKELVIYLDDGFSYFEYPSFVTPIYKNKACRIAEKIGKLAAKAFVFAGGQWAERRGGIKMRLKKW